MALFDFFKRRKERKEQNEQLRMLEMEIIRQGVLAVASRLDSQKEQEEFIKSFWRLYDNDNLK